MGKVRKIKQLKDGSLVLMDRAEIRHPSKYHRMNASEKLQKAGNGYALFDNLIERGLNQNPLSFYHENPNKAAKAYKKAGLSAPAGIRRRLGDG